MCKIIFFHGMSGVIGIRTPHTDSELNGGNALVTLDI